MNKKALIVGINYSGTSHELRGCVNDARTMETMLSTHFGFNDISLILDRDATTANILAGLNALVDGAAPGDILFFHYSGHGSQMIDKNGDEADGLDEIIAPYDLDWKEKVIRDDDMKAIFDRVPAGASLVVVLDCCNSGGGLDQANEYISPVDAPYVADTEDGRFLPPPENIMLMERKVPHKPRSIQSKNINRTGVLLTGCRSYQTSADAYIAGRYQGAFTYMLTETLHEHDYDIVYKDLIDIVNQKMVHYGFTQRPQLDGPVDFHDDRFLSRTLVVLNEPAPVPEPEPVPAVVEEPVIEPIVEFNTDTEVVESTKPPKKDKDDKGKNKLPLIAGAIALIGVVIFLLSK